MGHSRAEEEWFVTHTMNAFSAAGGTWLGSHYTLSD